MGGCLDVFKCCTELGSASPLKQKGNPVREWPKSMGTCTGSRDGGQGHFVLVFREARTFSHRKMGVGAGRNFLTAKMAAGTFSVKKHEIQKISIQNGGLRLQDNLKWGTKAFFDFTKWGQGLFQPVKNPVNQCMFPSILVTPLPTVTKRLEYHF